MNGWIIYGMIGIIVQTIAVYRAQLTVPSVREAFDALEHSPIFWVGCFVGLLLGSLVWPLVILSFLISSRKRPL